MKRYLSYILLVFLCYLLYENQDSKFILDKINKINSEIQELKAKIKKETNFNNKVKLNIDLKNKKDNLLDFKEKL